MTSSLSLFTLGAQSSGRVALLAVLPTAPGYSLIVRTTLAVGRASPPPGPFTSLRICSS
jgi:hypothetical protein